MRLAWPPCVAAGKDRPAIGPCQVRPAIGGRLGTRRRRPADRCDGARLQLDAAAKRGADAPIHEAGFPCGTFAYPNDYYILNSAQLLSSELRRFKLQYPERRVILVCHSMGGLVARGCVENSLYDPGNVERLIMIAPPTHGTIIAHFAVGTDLWEHWLVRRDGWPWQRLRDSIVDGLGEAANDMCPDSDFLTELNGRPLNPHVRYTILLGTGALFNEAQVNWIRKSVCESLAKMPGGEAGAKSLNTMLADIDELVEGKGDGVVAVKRGRLDGVADTVVMPFGHLAVTGKPALRRATRRGTGSARPRRTSSQLEAPASNNSTAAGSGTIPTPSKRFVLLPEGGKAFPRLIAPNHVVAGIHHTVQIAVGGQIRRRAKALPPSGIVGGVHHAVRVIVAVHGKLIVAVWKRGQLSLGGIKDIDLQIVRRILKWQPNVTKTQRTKCRQAGTGAGQRSFRNFV